MTVHSLNIAATLTRTAARYPQAAAVVVPAGRDASGQRKYHEWTFQQLDRESDIIAHGLRGMGVAPGMRIALLVRPGIEFIACTYALFKVGAVVVLIDPGMGGRAVFRCLDQVEPQGFVAVPAVHAIRLLNRGRFRHARLNLTVGRRWFWCGPTYAHWAEQAWRPLELAETAASDTAAILFTSGSTGPAKGVVYEHGMFAAQVEWLREHYGIEPGEIDLPGFPLFALFNAAMGVTTVIPDMNPSRPARCRPELIVEAIKDRQVTQAFGSPAIWNRVGRYCEQQNLQLPGLKRVLSAGAPVPERVLLRMQRALVGHQAEMYTPYGATEALPVASIAASAILCQTAAQTRAGAGTCVGRVFSHLRLKIIEIDARPIHDAQQFCELPAGEVGEIIVQGDVVTREYFRQPQATALAKIQDGDRFWHRLGDVGYLDSEGRLWFCGRKAHVVETVAGRMFTECCEPVFNAHPRVFRCALVGVGPRPQQTPVIIIEPEAGRLPRRREIAAWTNELQALAAACPATQAIQRFLFRSSLPVDIRHNVKIDRERLAQWAATRR